MLSLSLLPAAKHPINALTATTRICFKFYKLTALNAVFTAHAKHSKKSNFQKIPKEIVKKRTVKYILLLLF